MNDNNLNQHNQTNNMMGQNNAFNTQQEFSNNTFTNNPIQNNYGMQSNNLNQPNNKPNNKIIFIMGGIILLAIIVSVTLFFITSKNADDNYGDYDDYLKEQEKINDRLNENFTIKGYKIVDGILVEMHNENNQTIDADIKIEFYDSEGKIVGVETTYMFDVAAKAKSYEKIYVDDINYETYKVTAKLETSINEKVYNDKIQIVSMNIVDDEYLIQIKNNSETQLDSIEIGVLFLGKNNTIIAYEAESFNDINPGETTTGKVYLPYDENFDLINFEKSETIVTVATK